MRPNKLLSVGTFTGFLLAVVSLIAWWYAPCGSIDCATSRYLGVDFKVMEALSIAEPDQVDVLLERAAELNPSSLWVLQLSKAYARTPNELLAVTREIAVRFPYQHPRNFTAWAEAALEVGDVAEARLALQKGFEYFAPDRYPYGEDRMPPEIYEEWVASAQELLASLTE